MDGFQHPENAEAYRRDRWEVMLLQEHSDFALRFLAEDVGKQFDTILGVILRAFSHRRGDQ